MQPNKVKQFTVGGSFSDNCQPKVRQNQLGALTPLGCWPAVSGTEADRLCKESQGPPTVLIVIAPLP